MTHQIFNNAIAAVGIISCAAYSQKSELPPEIRTEWVKKVQGVSRQLRLETATDFKASNYELRDKLTASVFDEITKNTKERLAGPSSNLNLLRAELAEINGNRKLDSEHNGAPYVLPDALPDPKTVFTASLILRGGDGAPDSKALIQAYRREGASWRLAAQTGGEFDQFGLFVKEVDSGVPSERWFLAYGEKMGGNSRMFRMRIYRFAGEEFQVLWSPPDQLNVEISVSGRTLTLTYLDRERYYDVKQPPYNRTEMWLLSPLEVQRIL